MSISGNETDFTKVPSKLDAVDHGQLLANLGIDIARNDVREDVREILLYVLHAAFGRA